MSSATFEQRPLLQPASPSTSSVQNSSFGDSADQGAVCPSGIAVTYDLNTLLSRDTELRNEVLALRANTSLSQEQLRERLAPLLAELASHDTLIRQTRSSLHTEFKQQMIAERSASPSRARQRWTRVANIVKAVGSIKDSRREAVAAKLNPQADAVHARMSTIRSNLYFLRQKKQLSPMESAEKHALAVELQDLDAQLKQMLRSPVS